MKVGILSPYALPELGAASMRVDSFSKYFISKGIDLQIFVPYRGTQSNSDLIIRYNKISELKNRLKSFDYIILTCPSFYEAFKLLFFLKINKIKVIVDLRDFAENGNRKLNILFQYILTVFANKVTVVTEYMKSYLNKKYFISLDRISIIPNGVDRSIFYPSKNKLEIRKKLKLSLNSKLIVYEGIVGGHNLFELIKNLDLYYLKKNNIVFLFLFIIGNKETAVNIELDKIKKMILENNLFEYVKIITNVDPLYLREYISASDFGLVTLVSNKNTLYQIPIKTYEYIACGIPVIAAGPKNGMLHKFVEENNIGYFYENIFQLIKELKNIDSISINLKIIDSIDRTKSAMKMFKTIFSK